MVDTPERIWAHCELGDDNEWFIEFLSDTPWPGDEGVEFVRADTRPTSPSRKDIRELIRDGGVMATSGAEQRWIDDMENSCPHCGGSGHKDDVTAASPAPVWRGIPISTKERLPEKPGKRSYEHVRCLIFIKGEWEVGMWNCEHLVWDDDYGDDFRYQPTEPSHWMPLPAAPGSQPTEQPPQEKRLSRNQPCGCIVCHCEDDEQCQGCGAKSCGNHPVGEIPNPIYEQPPQADTDWQELGNKAANLAERMNDVIQSEPPQADVQGAALVILRNQGAGTPVADAFNAACGFLSEDESGDEITNEIIETFLRALAGEEVE